MAIHLKTRRGGEAIRGPRQLARHLDRLLAGHGAPTDRHIVEFGPVPVSLTLHGFSGGSAFTRALRTRRQAGHGAEKPCGFEIHALGGAETGTERPRLHWEPRDFGPRRVVPGWSGPDVSVLYLRSHDGLACVDWERGRAVIWLPSFDAWPAYERAAPLRWLFDLLAMRLGMVNVHAAAVGSAEAGVLVAGRGGAGKSTLALTCAGLGLSYAGDDYCLVEPGPPVRAHCLYTTGKFSRDAPVQPVLPRGAPSAVADGGDKCIIFLEEVAPERLASNLRLVAVVLPELTDGPDARFEPAPQHVAFRWLAPSTLAQTEGDPGETAGRLAALSRRLPAYRLLMPPDPRRSARALERLLGAPAEPAAARP